MIQRLLIANRGEIAVRIIRACRELGIESVAVYSDADANAPHVALATRAVAIGPPPAHDSYLAIPKIIDAARSTSCDAVHPGYGFLSERAAFAAACADAGLIFVGPNADAIARMGSKIEARTIAAGAGVPVVPGETPADQSDDGVREAIERVGLPALIKASAGGGGKGMRTVRDAAAALESIRAARREAQAAFGDGTLYVERLIDRPHHVEVQVFADAAGQTVHLFERDCSAQRRHQKVIEESPSPVVAPSLRARMAEAAVAVARAVGYRNAGTIEFLVSGSAFYFLEMNTRLQVEHPVTEQVTGLDLVHAQLAVAAGRPLPWTQGQIAARGHAIEARVYAEDPAQGFLPQAGRLAVYREPHWPGVRIDSGVVEGGEVPVFYDPMIAKVIATAETRPLAIRKLAAALKQFEVGGIVTNIPFLIAILESAAFKDGTVDTGYLDRESASLQSLVASRKSQVQSQGQSPVESRVPSPESRRTYDPWTPNARVAKASNAPAVRRASGPAAQTAIVAPMPATVVKINVKAGDVVKKGDTVVVVEAMKMELPLRALGDATVRAVQCREGELVQPDAVLVELT